MKVIRLKRRIGEEVKLIQEVLRKGGIALLPTDTVYGLAADFRRKDAIEKIYQIKERPEEKRLNIFIERSSPVYLECIPEHWRRVVSSFSPGPLSFILNRETLKGYLPDPILDLGWDSYLLRTPAHPLITALLRTGGGFLLATSANRSGEPPIISFEGTERLKKLITSVQITVDGGECPLGQASTILYLERAEPVRERRDHSEGVIPLASIESGRGRARPSDQTPLDWSPAACHSPPVRTSLLDPTSSVLALDLLMIAKTVGASALKRMLREINFSGTLLNYSGMRDALGKGITLIPMRDSRLYGPFPYHSLVPAVTRLRKRRGRVGVILTYDPNSEVFRMLTVYLTHLSRETLFLQ